MLDQRQLTYAWVGLMCGVECVWLLNQISLHNNEQNKTTRFNSLKTFIQDI